MASTQSINWQKSEVFFLNTQPRLQRELSRILNLRVANFPGRFMGTPLSVGSNKINYWEKLVSRCKSKLENWKGKWLSSARRLTMIKYVLSSMLIFSMACLKIPKAMEEDLIQIMRNFFRNGVGEQN